MSDAASYTCGCCPDRDEEILTVKETELWVAYDRRGPPRLTGALLIDGSPEVLSTVPDSPFLNEGHVLQALVPHGYLHPESTEDYFTTNTEQGDVLVRFWDVPPQIRPKMRL